MDHCFLDLIRAVLAFGSQLKYHLSRATCVYLLTVSPFVKPLSYQSAEFCLMFHAIPSISMLGTGIPLSKFLLKGGDSGSPSTGARMQYAQLGVITTSRKMWRHEGLQYR